jgi:uncharacterized protein YrzB (UPF0473 family)
MTNEHNCCCGDDNLEKDHCCEDVENEGCQCDCDDDYGVTMTVSFEDGVERECLVLGDITVDGKDYIALLPSGEEEYLIYEFREDEEGIDLINIEDDEEFNKIALAFEEYIADEFDDIDTLE